MQVNCKNCGNPFERGPLKGRWPQLYCTPKCRVAFDRKRAKLRYRHDPAYRAAVNNDNLQRYYRNKGQAEGSGTAL